MAACLIPKRGAHVILIENTSIDEKSIEKMYCQYNKQQQKNQFYFFPQFMDKFYSFSTTVW